MRHIGRDNIKSWFTGVLYKIHKIITQLKKENTFYLACLEFQKSSSKSLTKDLKVDIK